MAHLLGGEALHLEYPTKVVFDSVSLGVNEGDRIGIVGRNGDGKSSLLGMLAGIREPDGGRVTVRGGVTVGVLDQQDTLEDDDTIGHAVVGDRPEHEWAGDARTRDVIAGLLGDLPWDARLGGLSGGQRRRVALARLLSGDWDVLFLDEPTNHLDVEAVTWLAGHLKRRWAPSAGGLLVVTHDRWFLDEVLRVSTGCNLPAKLTIDVAHADNTCSANRRASASACKMSSTMDGTRPSCCCSVASITSEILVHVICPFKKASTATSFAALNQAGAVPPVRPAWYARLRHVKVCVSGTSKSSRASVDQSMEPNGTDARWG